MKIIFGDVARLLSPLIKFLVKNIKLIIKYYNVFYDGIRYAELSAANIDEQILNTFAQISSNPIDDYKTIVARDYVKRHLQNESLFKNVIINTLIEIIYFYKKFI